MLIWGNTERNRKIALINWDKVQKPKESGGLSFRGAKSTNYAFLMKLAWGILTNHQALWVQVLHSKYKVKDSDFSCHLQNAHCSNLWRGIAAVWVSLSKVLSGLWKWEVDQLLDGFLANGRYMLSSAGDHKRP